MSSAGSEAITIDEDVCLKALKEFTVPSAECDLQQNSVLESYIEFVAKTGKPMFPWMYVCPYFAFKLERALMEMASVCPYDHLPRIPNSQYYTSDAFIKKIVADVKKFQGVPFTIQRLCELLLHPKKHYSRADKFFRAIEKNVSVVTTIDGEGQRETGIATIGSYQDANGDMEEGPSALQENDAVPMALLSERASGEDNTSGDGISLRENDALSATPDTSSHKPELHFHGVPLSGHFETSRRVVTPTGVSTSGTTLPSMAATFTGLVRGSQAVSDEFKTWLFPKSCSEGGSSVMQHLSSESSSEESAPGTSGNNTSPTPDSCTSGMSVQVPMLQSSLGPSYPHAQTPLGALESLANLAPLPESGPLPSVEAVLPRQLFSAGSADESVTVNALPAVQPENCELIDASLPTTTMSDAMGMGEASGASPKISFASQESAVEQPLRKNMDVSSTTITVKGLSQEEENIVANESNVSSDEVPETVVADLALSDTDSCPREENSSVKLKRKSVEELCEATESKLVKLEQRTSEEISSE